MTLDHETEVRILAWERCGMPGIKPKWSDQQLVEAVAASTSWRGVCRLLGVSGTGNSLKSAQVAASRLSLTTDHFRGQGWGKGLGMGRNPELQRAAKKRWYDDNREVYRTRNARRRRATAQFITELKRRPCADCGHEYPPFAMEFDHRPDEIKDFNISSGRHTKTRSRLLEEIAKCDLVCVLCHRFRTARRAGWSATDTELTEAVADLAIDT